MASTADDIVDNKTFTEGDFTIISADNVRFRIQSYLILSASDVFADAGALPLAHNDKLVHMTDHDIENATVIEAFLQITNDWELDGDFSLDILDPLGQFLKKYNCWRPIAILCEGLRNRINEFTCYTVFKAAVYLDRESLIDSVCYKMEEIAAEQDDDDGLGSTRYGFADMAQEITPQDMLQFLPKYQWALVRTLAENECTSGCCTGDGDERGRPWVAFTHNLHEHKRLLQRQPRKKRKLQ